MTREGRGEGRGETGEGREGRAGSNEDGWGYIRTSTIYCLGDLTCGKSQLTL